MPVNPRTIPEYDTVAGVVMYWNPGSSSYAQIVTAVVNGIQPRATVFMQTNNTAHQQSMINAFTSYGVPLDNIVFIDVYGDRIWIRDHGPFSIYDNDSLAFVGFNDLATNHGDQDLPERLANYWDINYYDFNHIIFDGGNYLVDSHNRLFATNRLYTNNPSIPQETIDQILLDYMGIGHITTFLALSNDYWGHLDMQVKLLNDTTFIISTVDHWHSDYTILQDNYAILQSVQHPEGKSYQIQQIPKAQNWKTYINSLIVNDAVLVPIYNDPADAYALQVYQDLLPEKDIIGIDCNAMIGWEGAIHCITNQIPPFVATADEDEDQLASVLFQIHHPDGQILHDAVIVFDGTEYQAGHYLFENLEAGTYHYSIHSHCLLDFTGYLTLDKQAVLLELHLNALAGDANGDQVINVLDVIVTNQFYLGHEPDEFCFENADMNQDGLIDVLDMIEIINVYLEGRQTSPKQAGLAEQIIWERPLASGKAKASPITEISLANTDIYGVKILNINLASPDHYTLVVRDINGQVQQQTDMPAWRAGRYALPIDTRTPDTEHFVLEIRGSKWLMISPHFSGQ